MLDPEVQLCLDRVHQYRAEIDGLCTKVHFYKNIALSGWILFVLAAIALLVPR
jgi:hypothetical protein